MKNSFDLKQIKRNKMAADSLVSTKLITIILVILVLIAILFFIFKGDVLTWMKNLPSYGQQNDTVVEYNGDDSSVQINGVRVADFYKQPAFGRSNGDNTINVIYSDGTSEKTAFYWIATTPSQANIFYFFSKVLVGTYDLKKSGVVIDSKYLDVSSDINKKYSSYMDYAFSVRALARINGSYLSLTGGKSLYKNKNQADALIKGDIADDKIISITNKVVKTNDGRVQIILAPYFNGAINVFYLKKGLGDQHLNIVADTNSWWNNIVGDPTIATITPDGRIAFDNTKLKKLGLTLSNDVTFSADGKSSLKIDFKNIYSLVK